MNMNEPIYFLDSTTLIHAIDKDAEYREECLSIIGKAARGEIDAATSLETLEETLFILSKLTSAPLAVRVTRDYLRMTKLKKHEMSLSILEQALEIMEVTPLKRPKDAINVATMLAHGISTIVSEDKDYDRAGPIKRVHPKDL